VDGGSNRGVTFFLSSAIVLATAVIATSSAKQCSSTPKGLLIPKILHDVPQILGEKPGESYLGIFLVHLPYRTLKYLPTTVLMYYGIPILLMAPRITGHLAVLKAFFTSRVVVCSMCWSLAFRQQYLFLAFHPRWKVSVQKMWP